MATHAEALPGIAPGHLVRIAIPGRERLTASVTHATRTWLALRLGGPGSPRGRDLDGVRAAVEYIAEDGAYRLLGDLEQVPGAGLSTVRFVLTSGPQFLGRRRHLRTAMDVPVVLTDERTGEKFRGRSLNVSESGMLVDGLGSGLPATGARLRFALVARCARDPIVGTSVVIRSDGDGQLGVEFGQLSRQCAEDLARAVYENEQGVRARGR
jgi:hypothetical protein